MVYFTENIFKNILSYCDNRIERKQKKLMNNIIKDFTYLEKDLISSFIEYFVKRSWRVNMDQYFLDKNIYLTLEEILYYSMTDEEFRNMHWFNKSDTKKFKNKLIQK